MSRMTWIIVLVACGVGLAVLVGVLGTRHEPSTSKTEAVSSLCSSLKTLDSSVKTLTGIDTSTATMTEFNSDVTAVQNAWNQVTTDAQAVQNAPTCNGWTFWHFEREGRLVPLGAEQANQGYVIVQEFMIAANQALARWMTAADNPY